MAILDSYYHTPSSIIAIDRLHPSADASKVSAVGQTFNPNALVPVGKYRLTSCRFYLVKVGNPTGISNARLYAMSGLYGSTGVPTGSPLAVSEGVDVSTITPLGWKYFYFTGSQQYWLLPGVKYCIGYFNPETGTIDTSNYVRTYLDASGTHAGNLWDWEGGHWAYGTTYDDWFYVYGEPPLRSVIKRPKINFMPTLKIG